MKALVLATSLFVSAAALAQVPADGQFAVLKPRLSCQVKVPKGKHHSQVYFSSDCQTAYVLPSLNMPKTVLRPLLIADHGICGRLDNTIASLAGTDAKMKQLEVYIHQVNDQMAGAPSSDFEFLERKKGYYNDQLKELEKYKTAALMPFFTTPALRAQVRVESDLMDAVAAFQEANKDTVSTEAIRYPIRFVPAHITTSVLAVSKKDVKTYGKSTVKVDFPGLRYAATPEEQNKYGDDATLLYMNGSMSGIVDISAMTYCGVAKSQGTNGPTESDLLKAFDSAVAINMDYRVAVQAGVRLYMKADIKTLDFLTNVQSRITNSAFRRDEFFGHIVSGEALNALEIQVDDKGFEVDLSKIIFSNGEEDAEKQTGLLSHLIGKFISDYLNLVEQKLTKLGILEQISEQKAKEIAAGETTEVGGYVTTCRSSSSWFGLSRSKHCSTNPVYVQVKHDGISKLLKNYNDTSRIANEVVFETNQTTSVRHNSTFSLQ